MQYLGQVKNWTAPYLFPLKMAKFTHGRIKSTAKKPSLAIQADPPQEQNERRLKTSPSL